jgi:hypothetical protein
MKTKTLFVLIIGIILFLFPIIDMIYFNFKILDLFDSFAMLVGIGSLFIGCLTLIQSAYMIANDLTNIK